MANGLLSKGITLSYKKLDAFVELPDLQEIPAMGGTPDKVETTRLSDGSRTYINGIKDYGDLAFKFLYGSAATDSFRILQELQAEYDATPTKAPTEFQVEFPDGVTFTFAGYPSVVVESAGVNVPVTFTANVSLASDIDIAYGA